MVPKYIDGFNNSNLLMKILRSERHLFQINMLMFVVQKSNRKINTLQNSNEKYPSPEETIDL